MPGFFANALLSLALLASAREKLDGERFLLGPAAFTAPGYKPGAIRHIVLFRFRDGVTPARVAEVKRRFLALRQEARRNGRPYILQIDAGAQISGEGADHGYRLGFVVSFGSEGDRNYYVGTPIVTDPAFCDPAHQRFKDFVAPLLAETDGALVFDFRSE